MAWPIPGGCDGRSQNGRDDVGEERRKGGEAGSAEERIGNAESQRLDLVAQRRLNGERRIELLRCDGPESRPVAELDGSWQNGRLHSVKYKLTHDGPNVPND